MVKNILSAYLSNTIIVRTTGIILMIVVTNSQTVLTQDCGYVQNISFCFVVLFELLSTLGRKDSHLH